MGQDDGERHALLRLVGGVAEHQALTETETEGGLFLLNSLDRRFGVGRVISCACQTRPEQV